MKLRLVDLYNKYRKGNIIFEGLTPAQIKSKYYKEVPLPIFIRIAKADPKSKVVDGKLVKIGKYFKLMMSWYQNGELLLEDLPRATEYLELVYKHNVPINAKQIHNLSDLHGLISKYIINKDSDFYSILSNLPKDEYTQVFDGKYWMIFNPKTERAACHLGVNTEWCTAWGKHSLDVSKRGRDNYFGNYSDNLMIIVNKEDPTEKYQFHFPTEQYMDRYDRQIGISGWFLPPKNKEVMYFIFKGFKENIDKDKFDREFSLAQKILDREYLQEYIDANSEHIHLNELGMSIFLSHCDDVLPEETDEFNYFCGSKSIEFEFPKISDICKIIDQCEYIQGLNYLDHNASDGLYEYISDDYTSYFSEYNENSEMVEFVNRIIKDKFGDLSSFGFDMKRIFETITEDLAQNIIDQMYEFSWGGYRQAINNILIPIQDSINISNSSDIEVNSYMFGAYITEKNIDKIQDIDHLKQILSDYYEYILDKFINVGYYEPYNILPAYEYVRFISYEKFKELYNKQYDELHLPGYGVICDRLEKLMNFIKQHFNADKGGRYVYTNTVDDVNREFHIVIENIGTDVCELNKINIKYIDINGKTTQGDISVDSLPDYMFNHKLFEYRENFFRNLRK